MCFCYEMVHAGHLSIKLWMHARSWESTREALEWLEAKPSVSPAKAWTISFRTLRVPLYLVFRKKYT